MSASVRNSHEVYKNQPGRIEDYVPGRSSISEKEAKEVGIYVIFYTFHKSSNAYLTVLLPSIGHLRIVIKRHV